MIDQKYKGLRSNFESFPADHVDLDYDSYKAAIRSFQPGDICIIFVPDNVHCKIALEAIDHGLHTMVAKPITQTLQEHQLLIRKAREKNVLLCCEYHKRFDPCFSEAVMKMRKTGDFAYYNSFMSQPKARAM